LPGTGHVVPDLAEVYADQVRSVRTEHWSGPPEMVERIVQIARTRRGDVVIDVGCGVGGPARRLAELVGCRVVGVDLLEALVRAASERGASGVAFVAGSARRLPIRSSSADQVWALGVAAHVPDHDAMAAEIRRVLRPDGTLAVTEAFWAGRREPRFASSAPKPWRATTIGGFMSALERAGLIDVRALPWPGRDVPGSLDAADPALARDLRHGVLVPQLVLARCP
jgi:ubiquinone/menaquinone biosynthesis C-methylase UbiE